MILINLTNKKIIFLKFMLEMFLHLTEHLFSKNLFIDFTKWCHINSNFSLETK